ncbi:hypothetical protein DB347_07320 [Opitutaceae bacterium EW11]|nr:hypothetical protein DB347_07320 [Opitutaceae bacterium EW11]
MKFPQLLCLGLSLASGALAQDLSQLALPWKPSLENTATKCVVPSSTELILAAPPKTDLFISPGAEFRTDKSPRVVFRPEGPFILTAKVHPEFRGKWDAGVLLVYNDAEHFAKFCYERDFQGTPRIVSVVCNGTGDDCNSAPVPEGSVYFRVVGSSERDTFGFYASQDGHQWFPIRGFRLLKTDKLRIGLSAQSPDGDGCTVHFSQIDVQRRELKDYWKGD